MVITIDQYNFQREVLQSSKVVLVNFWSHRNEPCQHMRRLMREVDTRTDNDTRVVEVNWESENELARKYQVYGVPTLLIFSQGQPIKRFSGTFRVEEFMNKLGASQMQGLKSGNVKQTAMVARAKNSFEGPFQGAKV